MSKRAGAVHIDRAALQNHARIKDRQPRFLSDARRDHFIEIARRILAAPGVVIPIDDRQPRLLLARQENRAVIAAPRFVCRNAMKGEPARMQALQELRALPLRARRCTR